MHLKYIPPVYYVMIVILFVGIKLVNLCNAPKFFFFGTEVRKRATIVISLSRFVSSGGKKRNLCIFDVLHYFPCLPEQKRHDETCAALCTVLYRTCKKKSSPTLTHQNHSNKTQQQTHSIRRQ